MTFKLWNLPLARAFWISFCITLPSLILVTLLRSQPRNISPLLVVVAGVLTFVFLAQLPQGNWRFKLGYELACLVGSSVLGACGWGIFFTLNQDSPAVLNDAPIIFLPYLGLSAFSHVAVRFFARPAAVWDHMRQRRLVWEVTHAQLRLVLLTMFILCSMLLGINFHENEFLKPTTPGAISNIVTILIAIIGFFGVLTGILLFIVVIPASLVSYLTARRITHRLERLITVTHTIRQADYSARVTVDGHDEIAQLQINFNAMMDELSTARQSLEVERDTVKNLLESRQRLFADISHELRTPLAIIRSYLEPLKTDGDIQVVGREVLHLQHLIDDLFTLAQADANQLHYNLHPFDVTSLLVQTTEVIKKQAWLSRRVEVVLDRASQIPPVVADEKRLEQVLYNLLRNAVRHTPPGGLIWIGVSSDAVHVSIEVKNTGEGIAAEDLPYIWDRFYRSAETRAQDDGGAGLGLAIVKEMVEAMRGKVSVSSEVGQGSCFRVQLCRAE